MNDLFEIPAVKDQRRRSHHGRYIKYRVGRVSRDHWPWRRLAARGFVDVIEICQVRQQVVKRAANRSRDGRTRCFGEELQIGAPSADQKDQQGEHRRQRGRREARE